MRSVLVGQLIGAIREVWFTDADAETGSPVAIEIETKTGRYVHLLPTEDGNRARLCAGPFADPGSTGAADGALRRRWRDLTARVPAAFDGRPRVAAVDPDGDADADQAAREWRIVLDSGAVITCRSSAGGISVDSSPARATVVTEQTVP